MIDLIKEILNLAFEKLLLASGLCLIIVTIFCSKPLVIFKIKLPAIANLGRIVSGVFGTALILLSLFIWNANAKVGLFSIPPNQKNSSLLQIISPAYAQAIEIIIRQYHPKQQTISGETFGFYADNIKPTSPSRIIIFKTNDSYQFWGNRIDFDSLKQQVGDANIIFEASVVREGQYGFQYNNKKYFIRIKEILWYLFGADYMIIEIEQTR